MSPWLEGLEVGRQGGCFGEVKQKQSFFFVVGSLLPGERKVVLLPQDSTEPSLGVLATASPGGLSLPEASSVPLYLSSEALTPEPYGQSWTPAHPPARAPQPDKWLSDATV